MYGKLIKLLVTFNIQRANISMAGARQKRRLKNQVTFMNQYFHLTFILYHHFPRFNNEVFINTKQENVALKLAVKRIN